MFYLLFLLKQAGVTRKAAHFYSNKKEKDDQKKEKEAEQRKDSDQSAQIVRKTNDVVHSVRGAHGQAQNSQQGYESPS